MITYQVQVLNAEKQLIMDAEVKGHKNALAAARELPGAAYFDLAHVGSPYGTHICGHKFKEGWAPITWHRFQTVIGEGIREKEAKEGQAKEKRKDRSNDHYYPGSSYQAYVDTFPTWPGHAEKASLIENPPDWSKPETGEGR